MHKKLPRISGKDVVAALQKAGFWIDRQKGSHIVMRAHRISQVIVPQHKELKKGTLLSIVKQAKMSRDAFLKLL